MADYSPFSKPLNKLDAADLAVLRDTSEGWYVEYKSEVPNASSIAKSISAFANTYGGWLFYGIRERSKEDAVAGSFPGVARDKIDAALQCIRQAIGKCVNPSPHYDIATLWGPAPSVGLAADRAVLCIHVRWSSLAPHVHQNGVIYRRVADGSEPKPENDRALLDQLFKRSDRIREHYKEWVERQPELSKNENKNPYLRLLLVTDLWRDQDLWFETKTEEVRAIMGAAAGVIGALPFDTVYTTSIGFTARQLRGNDPYNLGLTWRFSQNLVSEILIPLNCSRPKTLGSLPDDLCGYRHISNYTQILSGQNHENPHVVDLSILYSALIGVVEIQRRILAKAGYTRKYFAKTCLLNVWRTVPFLDVESIIDDFAKFGVPMCLDRVVISPPSTHPDSFIKVEHSDEIGSEYAQILGEAAALLAPIAQAYGIQIPFDDDENDDGQKFLTFLRELQEAGNRAMEVQRLRNEVRPQKL